MLVDTGCMISTMSTKLYKKLNADNSKLNYLKSTIGIRNASDKVTPIRGMTTVTLIFARGVSVNMDIMISDTLSNDFILGYDFLGSPLVESISKKHIVMKKKGEITKISLRTKRFEPLASYARSDCYIASFQVAYLPIALKNHERVKENNKRFTLSKAVNKRLEILPTAFVLDKNQPNQYLVPVYNNSTNDIYIKNDTKLSNIEFLDGSVYENNIVDVNFLDIYNMDQYYAERNEIENTKFSQENNDIFPLTFLLFF